MARQKLKEYYEKTYRDHGFLYGTRILLAPQYKLSAFDDREYSTCHEDTSKSTELDRLLEPPSVSIFHEGVEYDEVDQYLREGTSNHQEALEEDEALKAIEEDTEPISDNKEIEESENLEGNSKPEETYQVQCTVVETGRSSIYRHIHEPEQ
ncbi:HAT dimerization [Penicillium solitum]|uniref:HAT dimerization n=1 Tax=Penicillium solitum TaxID=60172 RepID=UPI0032C49515|nr:HAT dimerization [Penicillium solitum]